MTDLLQREAIRRAESMKLFERNGRIHFGTWRKWWSAKTKAEADTILNNFKSEKQRTP